MALFNVSMWQRSRFTLQWFIINLVGSLACLTAVALAQFEWSEGVSGSVSIPDVALTCLGNLAVFMTAFTRGRLDVENGARDVLATTRGPKLNAVEVPGEAPGCVLTTRPPGCVSTRRDVDVVMLSKYKGRPHSSLTQFMQYISHSHALESILLQVFPVTPADRCGCDAGSDCQCVEFRATKEIMIMLAHRLPGTLKWLSDSRCLLTSLSCLKNGCHEPYQAPLYVEDVRDVEAARESSPAAVCEALNGSLIEEESSCICIPAHPGNADRWTKFMIKFLKSKEKEAKGIKVVVSDALQHYITKSAQELGLSFQTRTGCIVAREIYESASLILPRVAEVIVNMGLTGWLRVDGFSSSLVARRAIRDYVVDSAGTGFAANAFLTEAMVFRSADGTNVCQVLCFRGGILSARRVSYMVGCVNLICSFTWSVLIACEGNWAPSTPLSTPRLAVIIGAVGVALGMSCFEIFGGKVRAGAWARAETRGWRRARAWALDNIQALAQPQPQPDVQAGAQAQAQIHAEGHNEAQAQIHAEGHNEAQAQIHAEDSNEAQARVEAEPRDPEEAEVEALAQEVGSIVKRAVGSIVTLSRVRAVAEDEDEARARPRAVAEDEDKARARALLPVMAKVRAWAQGQAPHRGLVAVVILEVGCIASLVVRLSMKGGLGRWVYSGMQVLVWVKWGIGSFLLGDNATEDEDGNPYLFWTRNRGKWVYCSAFLLNAMLAASRYTI